MESPESFTDTNEHDSFGRVESSSFGKAFFFNPDCLRSGRMFTGAKVKSYWLNTNESSELPSSELLKTRLLFQESIILEAWSYPVHLHQFVFQLKKWLP